MGLVARRNLQGAGVDLDKIMSGKPGPQGGHDPVARQQERPAVGMDVRGPKGRGGGLVVRHSLVGSKATKYVAVGLRIGMVRPN